MNGLELCCQSKDGQILLDNYCVYVNGSKILLNNFDMSTMVIQFFPENFGNSKNTWKEVDKNIWQNFDIELTCTS
jgi:hypothetical protein